VNVNRLLGTTVCAWDTLSTVPKETYTDHQQKWPKPYLNSKHCPSTKCRNMALRCPYQSTSCQWVLYNIDMLLSVNYGIYT